MNKLISIILPTYNGSKWLRKAIESVQRQTYTNWELLVIDDGSIDNTAQIVTDLAQKDARIVYIKNERNLGIQKTLNKGLKQAKGEYVARIDDDDQWIYKDKLKKQIEFLEKNSDYVLVGTGVVVVDEEENEQFRYLVPETNTEIKNKLLGKNCFVHSSVLFNKSAVLEIGGYSESKEVYHIEDYDLWLKLGTKGKLANLPIYGVQFTLRAGSISSTNKTIQFKRIISLIKKYKKFYPNYDLALLRSVLRYLVYGFILKLPIKFSLNKIIKLYKEN